MTELTKAQKRVLDFIQAELAASRSVPTLREIAGHFGFADHRAAAASLAALKRKFFIESDAGKAGRVLVTQPRGQSDWQHRGYRRDGTDRRDQGRG